MLKRALFLVWILMMLAGCTSFSGDYTNNPIIQRDVIGREVLVVQTPDDESELPVPGTRLHITRAYKTEGNMLQLPNYVLVAESLNGRRFVIGTWSLNNNDASIFLRSELELVPQH